ncbi:YkgJ family cysteine cluster protein [PVC group bacterium]|nr:YkgJ family cysteine cluster protein [PVC group bacterium]
MSVHTKNKTEIDLTKFRCVKCGNCCRLAWSSDKLRFSKSRHKIFWGSRYGEPGCVYVTRREIPEIAKFLKLKVNDFVERFTRFAPKPYLSLIEKKDKSCVFLKDNRCQIYKVRPGQCRNYPFNWSREETLMTCEGVKKYCLNDT